MAIQSFTAQDLFTWVTTNEHFLLLDVRNDEEFARFKVEGPHALHMLNVPYMEFIEKEENSIAKVPKGQPIRVVCAKEGSSKFVAEILDGAGYEDLGHLLEGIKAWGNLLAPTCVHDGAYKLYQFRRPGKASCSYGLISGKEMMLFDPSRNVDFYTNFAKEHDCSILKTFETHRQADYISGSTRLSQDTGAQIVASPIDFEGAAFEYVPAMDQQLYPFTAPGPEVKALHTPGHTPGSTCYLIDGTYLISGDTVFIESIGRPDLGGKAEAWASLLFNTMTQVVKKLPSETIVLPGHYLSWEEADKNLTFAAPLGEIIEKNSAIYSIDNESDFFRFIKENMRTQPPEYATIRDINAGLTTADADEQELLDLGKNECAASAGVAG